MITHVVRGDRLKVYVSNSRDRNQGQQDKGREKTYLPSRVLDNLDSNGQNLPSSFIVSPLQPIRRDEQKTNISESALERVADFVVYLLLHTLDTSTAGETAVIVS